MTEQNVRERIRAAIESNIDPPYPYDRTATLPPSFNQRVENAADEVIAIIREAMLAPSTITAAHKGVPPPCQIERVLTNALNEVFGE